MAPRALRQEVDLQGAGNGNNSLRALFTAAATGDIMGLETLNFDMNVDLNQQGTCGRTALSVGAAAGHTLFVRLLRTKGARIYVEGCALDRSALHWAATAGQLSCIRTMLDTKPDPELGIAEDNTLELERRDAQGSTPVFLASNAKPNRCQAFLYLLRSRPPPQNNSPTHPPQSLSISTPPASHTPPRRPIRSERTSPFASPNTQKTPSRSTTQKRHKAASQAPSSHASPPPHLALQPFLPTSPSPPTTGRHQLPPTKIRRKATSPCLPSHARSPPHLPSQPLLPTSPSPPTSGRHQPPQSSPTSCRSLSPCSPSPSSVHHFPTHTDTPTSCKSPFFSSPPLPVTPPNRSNLIHHEPRETSVQLPPPSQRRQKGLAPGLPPRHAMPSPQEPPPPPSFLPTIHGRTKSQSQGGLGCNRQLSPPPSPPRYISFEDGGQQPSVAASRELDVGEPPGHRRCSLSARRKFLHSAAAEVLRDLRSTEEIRTARSPPPLPRSKGHGKERPARGESAAHRRSQPTRDALAVSCHGRLQTGVDMVWQLRRNAMEQARRKEEEEATRREEEEGSSARNALCGERGGGGLVGVRALKEKGWRGLQRFTDEYGEDPETGRDSAVAATWHGGDAGTRQRETQGEEEFHGTTRLPVLGCRIEEIEPDRSRAGGQRHLYSHWLRMDFLTMVVEAGDYAQLKKEIKKDELNELNKRGLTMLAVAARQGHKRCVCFLIREGASLFVEGSVQGRSALHWAAERGNVEVLQGILEAVKGSAFSACKFELKRKDAGGNTPISLACQHPGDRSAFLFLYRVESVFGGCAPSARTRTRKTVSLPQIMSQ